MSFLRRSLLVFSLPLLLVWVAPVNAAVFDPPISLSGAQPNAHTPSIAVGSGGVVHVVWAASLTDEGGVEVDTEVFYARSTDNGSTFSVPVNISTSAGLGQSSAEPVISIAPDQTNEIHVVWEEYGLPTDPSGAEVFYVKSTDGGLTWPAGNKKNLSNSVGFSGSPYLYVDDAAAGNRVHAAWTECPSTCRINYSKSADGGATFSAPLNASNNSSDNDQPVITANSSGIHLAWQGAGVIGERVYYTRSTDGGASFEASRRLTTRTDREIEPSMVIDGGGRLHLAWQVLTADGGDIFWTRSHDNGATFEPIANRSNSLSTVSSGATLSAPVGGQVSLAWSEDIVQNGVQDNQNLSQDSPNGGASWKAITPVAGPAEQVRDAALVLRNNRYFITWEEAGQIKFAKGA